MRDFATDFARGGFAPLTFDRAANPDGLAPGISSGVLHLAVQCGTWPHARAGDPERCDRCEVREPGKVPLGIRVTHNFVLRLTPGFPRVAQRFVAAQLKRNDDGGSPIWALRVEQGRLYTDWRLPGFTVEHHDSLAVCGEQWTRFDLTSWQDGAELAVNGVRVSRIRHRFGPAELTRYLKIGPYRNKHPDWGDGPAGIEVREVRRAILSNSIALAA